MLITIVSVLIFTQQVIISPSVSSDIIKKETIVCILTAKNTTPVASLANYCNRVSKSLDVHIGRNTPPKKHQTEYG